MCKIMIQLLVATALLFTVAAAEIQTPDESGSVEFVKCPRTIGTSHCSTVSFQFEAVNTHNQKPNRGIRYQLVWGPGEINERTGLWSFDPMTPVQAIWSYPYPVMVIATQGHGGATDTCQFRVRVDNYAPRPFLPGQYHKDSIPVIAGQYNTIPIWWLDRDSCDTIQKTFSVVPSAPVGALYLDDVGDTFSVPDVANLVFMPDSADAGKSFVVRLTAFDGIDSSSLELRLFVKNQVVRPGEYALRIERKHDVIQGQFQNVSVTLERASADSMTGGLGGFDILVGYDASALSLQLVENTSSAFYQQCNWEYFTYRYGAVDSIPMGYPSGYARVVGLAETNNGDTHPTCAPKYVPTLPATLFTMRFLVSNDRTLECQFTPIRFYWQDCGDNVLANWNGTQLHLAGRVYDYFGFDFSDTLVNPAIAVFPGTNGIPQDTCAMAGHLQLATLSDVDFYHGGLDIICADSIEDRCWQDWGFPPDPLVSGCVQYANYFVYDTAAIGNQDWFVKCSDVNADGIPLSLSDYVYMQHVIVGDALPFPPLHSSDTVHVTSSGTPSIIWMNSADTLGALRLVFEGEVTPELLIPKATMKHVFRDDSTFVLISGSCLDSVPRIISGPLINAPGGHRLVKAEAATYHGAAVQVIIDNVTSADDHADLAVPRSFALRQNYPNPFNAGTVISFDLPKADDVQLEIINIAGQVVHEVNRHFTAGSQTIEWDGNANGHPVASGIYYYRLTAGEFTATKKMVLLK